VSHETYQTSQNNVRGHISPQIKRKKIGKLCLHKENEKNKSMTIQYSILFFLHYFYDTLKFLLL